MKNLNILIIIFILSLYFPFFSLAIDTLTSSQPLTINQTLVSKGDVYELGFINPANKGNLYIAIWYKNIEPIVYVWVANRDNPITSSNSTLTIGENHNIVLSNETVTGVWSSNQSVSVGNTVAQLLDDGNFVLRPENNDDPENYIWQSFHYPTDTLLPGMKVGWTREAGVNRPLQSWKSDSDPGSGHYQMKMDIDGFPEILMYKEGTEIVYRTGPWNGIRFSGVPEMKTMSTIYIKFEFQNNLDEITYQFELKNRSVYSRLVMESSGYLRRFFRVETSHTWSEYWYAPRDRCDNYRECGPFGVCNADSNPVCKCMKGFRAKDEQAWDLRDGKDGCVRSSKLDCGSDGFLALKNMKLPKSNKAFVNKTMNLAECREICKTNCSCTAYADMNITGSGCVIWTLDLLDIREFAESGSGQDLYVRVAYSDADTSLAPGSSKSGSSKSVAKIASITVGSCAALIILLVLFYFKRKKMQRLKGSKTDNRGPHERNQDFLMNEGNIALSKKDYAGDGTITQEHELPSFDFTTLAKATNYFSDTNKLGQGGFGCVYKGILTEGEVVAVKRLSRTSVQGIEELRNEVILIAKLQHRNLVRLLGCCIEVEEKLLVYEYMENKSLDVFLFDKQKSAPLNWQKRFNIICGTARGLLYLHQDSRFRIIHRDLKASNILLDKEMNPKYLILEWLGFLGEIKPKQKQRKWSEHSKYHTFVPQHVFFLNIIFSIFCSGYMAPEYAMDGLFSMKSDVFSFGVLVLEIVTGQKNKGFYYASNQLNLLGHTWRLWNEGNPLELVEASIGAEISKDEVLRCIQIGLLCVQEHAQDRPNMVKVMLMLGSNTEAMPQPKYPGFSLGRRRSEVGPSSKQDESLTVNKVTVTILDGR